MTPGHPHGFDREGQGGVETVEQSEHLGGGGCLGQGPSDGGSHRKPGQVPAGVLAELPDPEVLAEGGAQQLGVGTHHGGDRAQVGRGLEGTAAEGVGQVAEQPRSAEAAPAHHHPVAPGGLDHGQGVGRLPQIAVAQHGDGGDLSLEGSDGSPVGRPRVELLGRAGVQGHSDHPLALGDATGLQEGHVGRVDPDPHLDGHRHRSGRPHRGGHDGPEQDPMDREGGPASLPGDFSGRASEVEVDVVDTDLVDQSTDGGLHHLRIDAAQLDAAYRLVGTEGGHPQGFGVALDQGASGDHLAHVQAGSVGAAQAAEGDIGHPGHGGEYHRRVDGDGAQLEGGQHGGRGGGRGDGGGSHRSAHRSVMVTSMSARRVRKRGRESPITLLGSPSTPSMNGADRPSMVKAPATSMTSGRVR